MANIKQTAKDIPPPPPSLPSLPPSLPSLPPSHPHVLLQSAVMAGLISRLLLVLPSWDKTNNVTYAASDVAVGIMFDSKRPIFCVCLVMPGTNVRSCKGQTGADSGELHIIDETKCNVRQSSFLHYQISLYQ